MPLCDKCHIASAMRLLILAFIKIICMKKNMGTTDKLIRILLAAIFAALYFTGTVTGTVGIVLLVLGAVFLATSLVSFCPLYTQLGINTCSIKKAS